VQVAPRKAQFILPNVQYVTLNIHDNIFYLEAIFKDPHASSSSLEIQKYLSTSTISCPS
jgi:hypothetical protein